MSKTRHRGSVWGSWAKGSPWQSYGGFNLLRPTMLNLFKLINSRDGLSFHHCCSSELSYSCSYCLSSHTDKVWLCCASLGQQSTQRPPSATVSIRLYQMLHSLHQPSLLRERLISSSTWCAEGWGKYPWGPTSITFCTHKAWAGCQDNSKHRIYRK